VLDRDVRHAHDPGAYGLTRALVALCPTVPFVNSALASRAPFRHSIESLRSEGVQILLGPGGFEPHPPRTGGSLIGTYPWSAALDEVDRLLDSRAPEARSISLSKVGDSRPSPLVRMLLAPAIAQAHQSP
jgi:hypothetical protein